MTRSFIALLFLVFGLDSSARAIQSNGGYVTTPPTVTNWTSGWPTSGKTGWDYVGQVNGSSAVYLGNGWVLTVRHVGSGAFTLNGTTYPLVSGSENYLTNTSGTADLTLFRVNPSPALSPLTISQSAPVPFFTTPPGDLDVMIGYGGGHGETWGSGTVTAANQLVQPDGLPYISIDFFVFYGSYTFGSSSFNNTAILVANDSGGGNFIYNTLTHSWELAGINEVVGSGTVDSQNVTFSGMVQMSAYASQINALVNPVSTDTPTLPLPALLAMAGLLLWAATHTLCKNARQI